MHAFSTIFDAENPGTAENAFKMAVMTVLARALRVSGAALVLAAGGGTIRAEEAIPICKPAPSILSMPQPAWPEEVETRGLPHPVFVTVEYTVDASGVSSDAVVVDRDAGGYAQEFEKLAIAAVLSLKSTGTLQPCRVRTKIVWKLKDP